MRKLIVLLVSAGFLLGVAGSAQAGEFVEETSTLGVALGGLPSIEITALPGTESLVTLGNGSLLGTATGHNVLVGSTVWSTINFGPGTSLFTGVPLISNLKFTVNNKGGLLQDGFTATNAVGGGGTLGPAMGGVLRLRGQTVIFALGGNIQLGVPLSFVGGQAGETTMVTLLGQNITATAGPFISAAVVITGLTSNIITIPQRGNAQGVAFTLQPTTGEDPRTPSTNGGFVSTGGGEPYVDSTVTISGTNNLASASTTGQVTVVAPIRVSTGLIAGTIPGKGEITISFVPEPGTMLLLVSGAVGLAVIGRRRMRK